MIESPDSYPAYGGNDLATLLSRAGIRGRPLRKSEPCPVLFRDAGPDGLLDFLRGTLGRLSSGSATLLFLHAASGKPPTRTPDEFGEIVLLRPMTLRPWKIAQRGAYVAKADRMPPRDSLAFIPAGTDRGRFSRAAEAMESEADVRRHFGARRYDLMKRATLGELNRYVEERQTLMRYLRSSPEAGPSLRRAGIRPAELRSSWIDLSPERRRIVSERIAHLARAR